MNKRILIIIILIVTFLLIVFLSYLFKNDKAISKEDIKDFFPLCKGNQWVYLSTSVIYDSKSDKLIPTTSTFKKEIVEVTEIIRDKHYTVALVKESILYSTDKEEGLKEHCYFIIKENETKYYIASQRNNEKIIKKIKEDKEEPSSWLDKNTLLFLDLPLHKNKTYGAREEWHNKVRAWCNFVESVQEIDPRELEGFELPDMDIFKKYKVVYRTNPDFSITYFVPGIGEVEHVYIHNGSFIRRYVRLLEYKRK